MFELPEGAEVLSNWGIDGTRYEGLGICILGYAAEGGESPAKPRKNDYILFV